MSYFRKQYSRSSPPTARELVPKTGLANNGDGDKGSDGKPTRRSPSEVSADVQRRRFPFRISRRRIRTGERKNRRRLSPCYQGNTRTSRRTSIPIYLGNPVAKSTAKTRLRSPSPRRHVDIIYRPLQMRNSGQVSISPIRALDPEPSVETAEPDRKSRTGPGSQVNTRTSRRTSIPIYLGSPVAKRTPKTRLRSPSTRRPVDIIYRPLQMRNSEQVSISPIRALDPVLSVETAEPDRRSRIECAVTNKNTRKRRTVTPTDLGPPVATSTPKSPRKPRSPRSWNPQCLQISPIHTIDPLPWIGRGKISIDSCDSFDLSEDIEIWNTTKTKCIVDGATCTTSGKAKVQASDGRSRFRRTATGRLMKPYSRVKVQVLPTLAKASTGPYQNNNCRRQYTDGPNTHIHQKDSVASPAKLPEPEVELPCQMKNTNTDNLWTVIKKQATFKTMFTLLYESWKSCSV